MWSHVFLEHSVVFPYQTSWQYSDGNPTHPLTGGGGRMQVAYAEIVILSQYLTPSHADAVDAKCNTLSYECDQPSGVWGRAPAEIDFGAF